VMMPPTPPMVSASMTAGAPLVCVSITRFADFGASDLARRVRQAERATKAVRIRHERDMRTVGAEVSPLALTRHRDRVERPAVIGVLERHDVGRLLESTRDENRRFVRLGA